MTSDPPTNSHKLPATLADFSLQKDTVQVDYLTHQWDESDLESSWKVITKKKNDVVNGARLENASWRTWAKQRNNLKTLRPETLNWLKDSDVTWLYGPLHTLKPIPKPAPYSTLVASKLQRLNLKSVLKRPPPDDIFRLARNPFNLTVPLCASPVKSLRSSQSEIGLGSMTSPVSPLSSPTTSDLLGFCESSKSTSRQKIRFNQKVEQCIAVDSEDDLDGIESDSSSSSSSTLETPSYHSKYFGKSSFSAGSSRTASVESFDAHPIFPPDSRMNDRPASQSPTFSDGDDDGIHFGRHHSSASPATPGSHFPLPIIVKLQPTTLKSDTIAKPPPEPYFLRDGTCDDDSHDSDEFVFGGSSSPNYSTSFLASLFLHHNNNNNNNHHGEFDKFDPDNPAAGPLPPANAPNALNSEKSKSLQINNGYRTYHDEEPVNVKAYGIVDQCQDIVINVADVVRWCGSMVFNSSIF